MSDIIVGLNVGGTLLTIDANGTYVSLDRDQAVEVMERMNCEIVKMPAKLKEE